MSDLWHELDTDPDLPDELRAWARKFVAPRESAKPIDRAPDLEQFKRQANVVTSLVREMHRVANDVTEESRNETIAVLHRVYERELRKLKDQLALLQLADRYNESLKFPDAGLVRDVESIFTEQEGES